MKKVKIKIICIVLSSIMFLQAFSTVTFTAKQMDKASSLKTAESAAYAVEELKSKRDANVKHFKMSDGTFAAATYDMPVHYYDGEEWQDINNYLIDGTDSDENIAVYENTDNPIKIKFAKKSNSKNILKLQQNNYKISFALLGKVNKHAEAQKFNPADDGNITTLEKTESKITYENIFENVDIEYVLSGTKLKENIVIQKELTDYTFKYEIKTNGLTMSLINNQIIFKDNNETVFYIPAPYMYDAEGEFSDAVTYSLENENGNKYILTITADNNWIDSDNRKFPVTIDPTVQMPESGIDTYYFATERNNTITHFGQNVTHVNNALRYSNLSTGTSNTTSLYMKINLPYLNEFLSRPDDTLNSVSYGTKVINAKLNLPYDTTAYTGNAANDASYSVHRITGEWTNNFTFSNRPSKANDVEDYLRTETWDIVAYDPSTNQQIDEYQQTVFTADITNLANDWYSGIQVNNGIYITPSIDGAATTDIGHRIYYHDSLLYPILTVSYICSIGIEDYFSYTSTDLDGLASGYVNNLTGSLNFLFTDHATSNNRNGMSISHVYNDEFMIYDHLAINTYDSVNNVGKGFKLNIQQSVNYNHIDDIWTHMDADGTYHFYYPKEETANNEDEPTVYINEEGLGSILIPDENDPFGGCTITYKSGTKYIFGQRLLKKIIDKNNNTIEIIYASNIGYDFYPVQVKEILSDNESRITQLEWISNGNKLSKIIAPDNSVVSYTYDAQDPSLLKEVTFSSSGSYTSAGAGANTKLILTYITKEEDEGKYIKVLSTVTNTATGVTVEFSRNTNTTRVNYIEKTKENASIERTKFTYEPFFTQVEDQLADYYYLKYIFNRQGLTEYVTDSEGNSKKYEYSQKKESKNKLSFESNTRRIPGNIIKNGNFKTGTLKNWNSQYASYNQESQMLFIDDLGYVKQEVIIPVTGYYTLSAVIDNYDADVIMRIEDINGVAVKSFDIGPTDGPETKQITANLSTGIYTVRIRSEYKGFMLKNVQLTRGTTAEEYNLVTNSDFYDNATGWTKTGFVNSDDLVGSYCEISGDYKTKKMLSQTIDVDDSFDTLYVFGAMVSADCLPNRDNGDGTDTCVAITLELDYTDGEKKYTTVFCEPKTGDGYVNLFGSVKASYYVDKIKIYLKNLYNNGIVKFDDVYIFRDSAGVFYDYDDDGNMNYSESTSGAASNAVYNDNGDIISSTDARNLTTQYEYDNNRNLTKTISPSGINSNSNYDQYGNVTSANLSKGNTTLEGGSTIYDENGMYVTTTTDAFGYATEYTVDETTLKTQEVKYAKPSAQSDRFNYNVEYDYYDNQKAAVSEGDTSTVLENSGPIKSIYAFYEGYTPAVMGVSFEYDDGEISKIKRSGYDYTFYDTYTAGNEPIVEGTKSLPYSYKSSVNINDTDSSISTINLGTNLYDASGNLSATIYGNTNYHTYERDVFGRLTAKNTLRDKLTYTYNSKNLLAGVYSEYNNTSNTYNYDFAGRMSVSEFYDLNNSISMKHKYTYNSADMLTGLKSTFTDEDGQRYVRYTEYDYDNEGRITSQDIYKEGSGSVYLVPRIQYNYNDVGLLTGTVYSAANQVSLSPSINRNITYNTVNNDPNKLTSQIKTYDNFSYTYDIAGNIKSVSAPYINSATYLYDETNQLTHANGFYDREHFVYDYNGNIITYENSFYEQGYTTEYEYTFNYDSLWEDRLMSVTTANGDTIRSYSYMDQYGAGSTLPTRDGRFNFDWDGRLLTRATRISNYTTYDYKYDENGKLIEKKVKNGDNIVQKLTRYYYTGDDLTTEVLYYPVNGSLEVDVKIDYIYDTTGLSFIIFEFSDPSKYYLTLNKYTFYVKRNAQGDVTALADITNGYMGDQLTYTYSAYGKNYTLDISGDLLSAVGSLNSILFKGYMYDRDLEMYYCGSRWYDPEICRFINGDSYVSTGQGLIGYNMFAYCGNNPVNRVDPEGEFWIPALVLAIGSLLLFSSCSTNDNEFKSADEAAKDFAKKTYSATEYTMHEYSTEIYTTNNGKTYKYTEPAIGSPHQATGFDLNHVPEGGTTVAYAHTHPNYNGFSDGDIETANHFNIDAYVISPNHELLRYIKGSTDYGGQFISSIEPDPLTSAQKQQLNPWRIAWDEHIAECDKCN